MSNEEPDLPVAATVKDGEFRTDEFSPMFEITTYGRKNCRNSEVELTKVSDAEEAIQKARQSERQEILDKIEDKRDEFNEGRRSEYPQTVCTELIEDLRDDLQQDQEENGEADN